MTFRVDGAGNFATDGVTGLPIPDPNGKPYSKSSDATIGSDPNADANGNRTADQCEFHNAQGGLLYQGSRCDTLAHRCTLPLHLRTMKTIPWYYAPGSAADLFPSTARALNEWNISVKRAALIGQVVEGTRVGSAPSFTVAGDLTEDKLNADHDNAAAQSLQTGKYVAPTYADIFVLCHSPVIAGDNPACGDPGTVARIGDLRYNSVNVLTNPQTPSPWGIMVDADDPITGEKVVTSVNEWGAVLDIAAQGTEDILRWINGEISDTDITSGNYMLDWMKATAGGASQNQPTTLSAPRNQGSTQFNPGTPATGGGWVESRFDDRRGIPEGAEGAFRGRSTTARPVARQPIRRYASVTHRLEVRVDARDARTWSKPRASIPRRPPPETTRFSGLPHRFAGSTPK